MLPVLPAAGPRDRQEETDFVRPVGVFIAPVRGRVKVMPGIIAACIVVSTFA